MTLDTSEHTILVVDDDPGWRILIRDELEDAGFSVIVAKDLTEARGVLEAHPVSLVVLDVLFTSGDSWGPSGLDFAQELRRNGRWVEIPIVFCTVVGRTALTQMLQRFAGNVAVVCKPSNFNELKSIVRRLLEERVRNPAKDK